ncbi:hypothetical protein ACQ4PT_044187 [Festuca glaucescens]
MEGHPRARSSFPVISSAPHSFGPARQVNSPLLDSQTAPGSGPGADPNSDVPNPSQGPGEAVAGGWRHVSARRRKAAARLQLNQAAHAAGFFLCDIFSAVSSVTRKMASRAGGDGKEPINEQVVANTYANMRAEMNQLYTKITELEMEVSEHSLVIGAIEPLDPTRRCYRMIGGVLVERTIKEVLPAVHRNKEGLEDVVSRMKEALEKKKKEITEFELKYKIRIRKGDGNAEEDVTMKEASAQGVLVGPAGGQ